MWGIDDKQRKIRIYFTGIHEEGAQNNKIAI